MSRCFPFPPPGHEKNTKDQAALTESIKRERDRAEKERRKEKKREKKEKKKKEKKEKSKIKEEVEKKTQSHKDEGATTDLKFIDYQKRKDYEIEQQLERSSLSEEHGEPNSVPKVCDSSDSTQNSGKRKRHNSPLESQTQSTMFRIRLPLGKHRDPEEQPSKEQLCSSSRSTKHNDQELLSGGKVCSSRADKHRNIEDQLAREQLSASARSANNHRDPKELLNTGKLCFSSSGSKPRDPEQFCREQPASSSRGTRGLDEVVRREQLCSPPSGTKCRNLAELPGKEHFCSSSGKIVTTEKKMADNSSGPRTGTLTHKMAGPGSSTKLLCSVKGKAEVPPQDNSEYAAAVMKLGVCGSGSLSDVQLRNLIDNWVPPPIQTELTDFDDQEWLFDLPLRSEPKRAKVIDVAPCNERTSMWPRACYLLEAEIYALPYTVPF